MLSGVEQKLTTCNWRDREGQKLQVEHLGFVQLMIKMKHEASVNGPVFAVILS